MEQDLVEPPDDVLHLLTDAHCHPTDDPAPWENIDALSSKLKNVKIGRVCAMSTSNRDQAFVAQLARELPGKIVPAFGYHPWFSHKIAVKETDTVQIPDAETHYRRVLGKSRDSEELDMLVKHLEKPRTLDEIIAELRKNLMDHPSSILGEVGIDRVFRLPKDPRGWSREPDEEAQQDEAELSLGRRKRPLSSLSPSIEHQLAVVKAQIAVAIELGRSVSLHSVRAGGALMQLFDDLSKAYPGELRLSKRERKRRDFQTSESEQEGSNGRTAPFDRINIDLHSCTLSAEMIQQLQRKYANVFVSFSLAINSRQRDFEAQLRACDPHRLLIESDWHSAQDLGARCWTMVRLATDVIGAPLATEGPGQEDYRHAAALFHQNWIRFVQQS
jgi:Tat protein secretion system quality control protein TatD with DNase activity